MKIGRCCAGDLCQHPNMQLWGAGHSCSKCDGIVHLGVSCSKSLVVDGDDVHICVKCYSSPPSSTVAPSSLQSSSSPACQVATPSVASASVATPSVACRKCGGLDHLDARNSKCKYFKGRKSKKRKTTSQHNSNSTPPKSTNTQHTNNDSCNVIENYKPVRKPNVKK